ncbi:MAG TPA: hypothetical protein VHO07_28345 [Streptosporangiaceae bacterium]|jgi:hypothetical protein|nr:hypothetical protein [Streptosporangiaceae bacterium]
MHGMLSAAILIGVFAVAAAACLYAVVRVGLTGTRRGPDAGQGQAGQVQAGQGQAGQGQEGP